VPLIGLAPDIIEAILDGCRLFAGRGKLPTRELPETMEKIGNQQIWSYFDERHEARPAKNQAIRAGAGHRVHSYFELAKKVAELRSLTGIMCFCLEAKGGITERPRTTACSRPAFFG